MSLIKFPTQIKPDRVTMQLQRYDEIMPSPITGIQQVASRGGAHWRWTYEFKDLSESERDTVQAFLAKCRGSLNTFKIHDPGNYQLKGSISNWIDIFSGYGTPFRDAAGSGTGKVNSWFNKGTNFQSHISDDGVLRLEWLNYVSQGHLEWMGHATTGIVNSFQAGKAYVMRVKNFNYLHQSHTFSFRAGSGSANYVIGSAVKVNSSDAVCAPFYMGNAVNSIDVGIVDWSIGNSGSTGHYWGYADYRLARCALVSNSENLIQHSNNFAASEWIVDAVRSVVQSGWMDKSPVGVSSGGWKFFGTSAPNTSHPLYQAQTKIATEDLYTMCIYAQAAEHSIIRLLMDDGTSSNVTAYFNILSSTVYSVAAVDSFIRPYGAIFNVGSGINRCQLSAVVSSRAAIRFFMYLVNSNGATQFTNNGSAGIYIFGAQLRKFPFMGQYVPTTSTTVVGTGWQTGEYLVADGFDARDVIKAGTRLEIVNRFNNPSSNYYQRSEFKKVTEEVVVHREGWAIIPVDPPIRNAPKTDRSHRQQDHLGETVHNPVIFDNPELKARLVGNTVQYIEKPLQLTDIVFDVIEDLTE